MSSTPTASHLKRPLRLDRTANTGKLTKPYIRVSPRRPSISAHRAGAPEQAKASHGSNEIDPDATSSSVVIATVKDIDPGADVDTLHKQYRSISRHITQMRQSLDTAQQAMNILQNDQTAAIEALIEKWRSVVRDAADELYEPAKERVNREGGLARSRRRSYDFYEGEPSLTAEQQEMLQVQQAEDRAEAIKYGLIESIEQADHDPQESFTMATMLRQMDIDPVVVGYDEKEERWGA